MDFYKIAYEMGYLKLEDLKEATKWGCLNKEDFLNITGHDFLEEIK